MDEGDGDEGGEMVEMEVRGMRRRRGEIVVRGVSCFGVWVEGEEPRGQVGGGKATCVGVWKEKGVLGGGFWRGCLMGDVGGAALFWEGGEGMMSVIMDSE